MSSQCGGGAGARSVSARARAGSWRRAVGSPAARAGPWPGRPAALQCRSSTSNETPPSRASSSSSCVFSRPSGISSNSGRACASMRVRPSGVVRSQPSAAMARSWRDSGTASLMHCSKASVPCSRMKVSGSCSAGRKRNRKLRVSPTCGSTASIARAAARRPAASPSKLKTRCSAKRSSLATWSAVQAVPSVATALPTPSCASATTSM